jgi:hypothetical protein
MAEVIRAQVHTEQLILAAEAATGGPLKVNPRTQPVRSRKTFLTVGLGQALKRARPFERRALSTLRPPLLVIRARKPWVRLRLITLG